MTSANSRFDQSKVKKKIGKPHLRSEYLGKIEPVYNVSIRKPRDKCQKKYTESHKDLVHDHGPYP